MTNQLFSGYKQPPTGSSLNRCVPSQGMCENCTWAKGKRFFNWFLCKRLFVGELIWPQDTYTVFTFRRKGICNDIKGKRYQLMQIYRTLCLQGYVINSWPYYCNMLTVMHFCTASRTFLENATQSHTVHDSRPLKWWCSFFSINQGHKWTPFLFQGRPLYKMGDQFAAISDFLDSWLHIKW